MSSRRLALAFALIFVALLARSFDLEADTPANAEYTQAPVLDAYWYLSKPIQEYDGFPSEPFPTHDRPLHLLLARPLIALLGTSIPGLKSLGVIFGMIALILAFILGVRHLGPDAGLTSLGILALCYPLVMLDRTPLIYPLVNLVQVAAVLLWLSGARRCDQASPRLGYGLMAAAWLLALVGTTSLKLHVAAVLPALAAGHVSRGKSSGSPKQWLFAALLGLGLAGGLSFGLGWAPIAGKIRLYIGTEADPIKLLGLALSVAGPGFPYGAGAGIISHLPGLFLGGLATTMCLAQGAPSDRRTTLTVLLAWSLGVVALVAPLAYRPLRYILPLYLPLALCTGWFLREGQRLAAEGEGETRSSGLRLVAGTVLFLLLNSLGLATTIPRLGLLVAATIAALFGAAPLAKHWNRLRSPLTLSLILVFIALNGGRWSGFLHHRTYSLRAARRALDSALPKEAVVIGPAMPALLAGSQRRRLRAPWFVARRGSGSIARAQTSGATHIALFRGQLKQSRFLEELRAEGCVMTPSLALPLRSGVVLVFRFPWSKTEPPPTLYEQAMNLESQALGPSQEAQRRRGLLIRAITLYKSFELSSGDSHLARAAITRCRSSLKKH